MTTPATAGTFHPSAMLDSGVASLGSIVTECGMDVTEGCRMDGKKEAAKYPIGEGRARQSREGLRIYCCGQKMQM